MNEQTNVSLPPASVAPILVLSFNEDTQGCLVPEKINILQILAAFTLSLLLVHLGPIFWSFLLNLQAYPGECPLQATFQPFRTTSSFDDCTVPFRPLAPTWEMTHGSQSSVAYP